MNLKPIRIPKLPNLNSHKVKLPNELKLNRTYIVGILNVTPDSFSDGNKYYRLSKAIDHALEMIENGADIIDIGGESTRPGSKPVLSGVECKRVIPIIENLVRIKPNILISIDTYKSEVANEAIKAGARIVNDISGLGFDSKMVSVVSRYKIPVILMHIKKTPQTMQINPTYSNLKSEIFSYFKERINFAVKRGIDKKQIIIDPGLGFGKRLEDNYKILGWLEELHELGQSIMVGPSRKSFIGKLLGLPPQELIEGTAAVVTCAVLKGVHFIRIHDIKEMKRVITIAETINKYDR